ncbi:MAG TPA: zinc ribbon domain-containing protein [Pyrinomonadaceae bacterium]|nr:zinc ribbon domain-containing protein [Pyrinomonadaceae bacterium]
MEKHCPQCGVRVGPRARFCRMCGAPLEVESGRTADDPLMQTLPAHKEVRPTEGLSIEDLQGHGQSTSRLGSAEVEELLQRAERTPQTEAGPDATDPEATLSGARIDPDVTLYAAPQPAGHTSTPAAQSPIHAPSKSRARGLWVVFLFVGLIGVVLVAGLLTLLAFNRMTSSKASDSSKITDRDQKQQVASESVERATQPVPTPSFSRKAVNESAPQTKTVNVELSRDRSTQIARKRSTEAVSSPAPSVSPTPSLVKRRAPAAPPASKRAAQHTPESYYFQALEIIKGRDLKKMPRADLLRALEYFQRAALDSAHRQEARRYAERLAREFDRRKGWP